MMPVDPVIACVPTEIPPFAVRTPARVRAPVEAMKSVPVLPIFVRILVFASIVPGNVYTHMAVLLG